MDGTWQFKNGWVIRKKMKQFQISVINIASMLLKEVPCFFSRLFSFLSVTTIRRRLDQVYLSKTIELAMNETPMKHTKEK
jgi:hypothetical protein